MNRRGFIGGLLAIATPAVIRTPGLLMPICPVREIEFDIGAYRIFEEKQFLKMMSEAMSEAFLYGDSRVAFMDGGLVAHIPLDAAPEKGGSVMNHLSCHPDPGWEWPDDDEWETDSGWDTLG